MHMWEKELMPQKQCEKSNMIGTVEKEEEEQAI